MRAANPELEQKIKDTCLELLIRKEPEEISMREIAAACGVTATTLYYYYKDKESLFETVKIDCLHGMDTYIMKKVSESYSTAEQLRLMLIAFRDWALENPRIALLVMSRLKPNVTASAEKLATYEQSTRAAKTLLDTAVAEGLSSSTDTLMDTSLCIAAVWGAVETVLLNRTVPEYWNRGRAFTDRMIDLCLSVILSGNNI
ncbi:MAG: TetR/AcrR family transcriptional regulator [Spirochaetaceae bacterium]|jgi:AcrR family transcriptional regulator|nr:TetR/AcrR family transcriptional regulator [Spirochaetaceae bacterium]